MTSKKKKPTGRPTRYKKEFDDLAFNYTLLGAKDTQLAEFFNTSEKTINTWKKRHKSFLQSIKKGKEKADGEVAQSLYKKALGYEYEEEEAKAVAGVGVEKVTVKKKIQPDTTSIIFWLKNRQPELWRDKKEVKHDGPVELSLEIVDGSEEVEEDD